MCIGYGMQDTLASLTYKRLMLKYFVKFENSKWLPFLTRQIFFENWHSYSAEIPCGSKISSKTLYPARFLRYKHFYVLQFLQYLTIFLGPQGKL